MLSFKNRSTNLLALGYIFQGLTGLATIGVPTFFFNKSQIGVIGICISIQFILSQFFGAGLHFSALYYKSLDTSTISNQYCSISSKINITLVSMCVGILFYLLFPYLSFIYVDFLLDDFKFSLILSIILIAINKVLFSELNATKSFSTIGKLYIFKSLTFLIGVSLIILNKIEFKNYLKIQLILPELVIYLFYLIKTTNEFFKLKIKFYPRNLKRDLSFGIKSLWGTIFLESSTKIDVLMLGLFLSPDKVGVYSIISMISDLFLNVCSVLRSIINPEITFNFVNNKSKFLEFISSKVKICYRYLVPFLVLIFFMFYISSKFVFNLTKYDEVFIPLFVLLIFLALVSGYIPLMLTFGQIGKPNKQSFTFFLFFISNLILNFLLIPIFGLIGASLATGISYLIYVYFFRKYLSKFDQ